MLDRKPRSLHVDAERVVERGLVERGDWTELGDPAARSLGLSLAAISRQMGTLEEELGAKLLVRTTRSLRLTDQGRRFHEHAARLVRDADAARAARASTLQCEQGSRFRTARASSLLRLPRSGGCSARHPHTSAVTARRNRSARSRATWQSRDRARLARGASSRTARRAQRCRSRRTGSSMTSHSRDALVDRARSADSLTSASRSAASAFIAERPSPKCSSIASK